MGLKNTLAGLAALLSLGMPGCFQNSRIKPVSEQEIAVNHNIDKSKKELSLECASVDEIAIRGFEFYACSHDVSHELLENLEFVADVKAYGRDIIGMKKSKAFNEYKNNVDERPKRYYRLYITRKLELPDSFDGNFIGIDEKMEYRKPVKKAAILISAVDDLRDEEEYYASRGYDIYWRSYTDFAGGCDLNPEFFKDTRAQQAGTILHEEWHITVYDKDFDSRIEESLACAIGNGGAKDFAIRQYGAGSKEAIEAEKNLQYWLDYSRFIVMYYEELKELYANGMPLEKKLGERRVIMEQAKQERQWINNSLLWDRLPYTKDYPFVHRVYESVGSMKELARILKETPKEEDKAVEYLKKFLKKEK